ncbi:MAG TPA: PVC-type heme-binding CxxCH protein, partial [Gemmataceae bacterium]
MTTPRLGAALVAVLCLAPNALFAQNLTPQQALERMKLPEGFRAYLVASEPEVRQPVSITIDERGRMWVVQYLQYPNPAGLKPVKVDEYLRTVWDRVPEPPPHGPKGIDRITILSDPDEHGRYRKAKDFVSGLNLASGMTVGYGGAWIVQPPYLLFYPDKDRDDVPDGDPEVVLSGFGMEDSHAYANSLQWGPDGWLYGAHGSTVSASIRNPADPSAPPVEFEQGIWRYHPRTKRFELFSEGGGNTWGLDFDRHGQVIAGTNFGGKAMLHQVQGAYHVKNFGKHGPLHNPHTYGFFDHVPHEGFKGGHVTCGGIVYQGDTYPEKFRDQYVAGNLLSNDVYWHWIEPYKSSFRSRQGDDFLTSGDPWFRPVDCLLGPDGSVYVVDWHDKRAAHLDPIDNWDRTNGRVYKIAYEPTTKPYPKLDLGKKTSPELVELLRHPNKWYRDTARRLLGERRDPAVHPVLAKMVRENSDLLALESLWALYVSGGLGEGLTLEFLRHPNEHVRAWTVRLIGDEREASSSQFAVMEELARQDPSPVVRQQLACTAKRLPTRECLTLARGLIGRDEDADDPYIPMLIWWAVEDKAVAGRGQVFALLLGDAPTWERPLFRRVILERIGRRYMAEGSDEGFAACAKLLALAPDADATDTLIRGMEKALEGRRLAKVPAALEKPLAAQAAKQPDNLNLLRFAVRLGSDAAYRQALARVADDRTPDAERARLVELLSQAGKPDCVPVFLVVLTRTKKTALQQSLLLGLQA